jgi:hypothetical protein
LENPHGKFIQAYGVGPPALHKALSNLGIHGMQVGAKGLLNLVG